MHITYTTKILCHKSTIRSMLLKREGGRISLTSMAKYLADAKPINKKV